MARQFSGSKKARILAKTNGHCWYCGVRFSPNPKHISEIACLDHVIPECVGGTNDDENLVPSCRKCNSLKSVKSVDQFRHELWLKSSPHARAAESLVLAMQVKSPFKEQIEDIIGWHLDQAPEHVFYGELL